jgi:putative transposase
MVGLLVNTSSCPTMFIFSARPKMDAKPLPKFVQAWKQWTSKRITRELDVPGPVWQEQFFDHVLRSTESFSQKWDYVRKNPVRAGLVAASDDWPWQGKILTLVL